ALAPPGLEIVFFTNSGAESAEAAIKLARKYSWERWGEGRSEIITMVNSFHGRTLGTLTATAQEKFHKGFAPLMPGFRYVPFDDIKAVKEAVTDATCAVLVEPIQGEGGVNLPGDNYLGELRELCQERGLLLIYDEVQTGMGRTGKLFAYQNWDVPPDIMTLAKGLAGGCPIGAMLAREEVAAAFKPGDHAATFGGNPLATAAGLAALELLSSEETLSHCRAMGERMREGLKALQERHPVVREVRGMGLLNAMELDEPGGPLVSCMMERGFLINCTMERVLRFLPPLFVGEEEVDALLKALEEGLAQMTRGA
ncbi:MAG: aminotransferase class III-fold pyridoxal phosphate-dependent enzyme, partial [Nitrospinota bacterium]